MLRNRDLVLVCQVAPLDPRAVVILEAANRPSRQDEPKDQLCGAHAALAVKGVHTRRIIVRRRVEQFLRRCADLVGRAPRAVAPPEAVPVDARLPKALAPALPRPSS